MMSSGCGVTPPPVSCLSQFRTCPSVEFLPLIAQPPSFTAVFADMIRPRRGVSPVSEFAAFAVALTLVWIVPLARPTDAFSRAFPPLIRCAPPTGLHSGPISGRRAPVVGSEALVLRLSSSSSPLGDIFSGLTGSVPKGGLGPPPDDLLAGTSIDPARPGVDLTRAYRASTDGWTAVDFHRAVDGRGSGIVLALSRSGKRFGGFNPLGWMSTDDYGASNAAFLWFEGAGGEAVRCPVLSGGEY